MMKNFLNAVGAFFAFIFGIFVFMRFGREKKPSLDLDKMNMTVKLKEIEAANEIEQHYKDKSDRDIVLDAINKKSGQ